MLEHTPKPWSLEWDGREQRIAKDGIGIARIEPWLGDSAGEQAANAYLLKMAPELKEQRDELLEALEAMDKWLSQYKHYGVALNIMTQARTAIAKAKRDTK